MKAELYNQQNQVVREITIPGAVFGATWKPEAVRQVLLAQRANARTPWAHAKDRGEVRGGGRKPWRQKGTGRARHGSIRSPLWSGGGKAHGPQNERDYSQKVNKKMKRSALFSLLSKKFKDGEVRFFDTLRIAEPKTKLCAETLRAMRGLSKKQKKFDVLLIPASGEVSNIERAARNLTKTKVLDPRALNVYDALAYKYLFVGEEAIAAIQKHFTKTA